MGMGDIKPTIMNTVNDIYIYIYNSPTGKLYHIYIYIWVNYSDLTATSLEIMVNKGNHPQLALIQVSEIL